MRTWRASAWTPCACRGRAWHRAWCTISAVSRVGQGRGWGVDGGARDCHRLHPEEREEPPRAERHGRRGAPAASSTGERIAPRGTPPAHSPAWRASAAPDRHPTPSSRGARFAAWLLTPHSARDACHACHPPACVSAHSPVGRRACPRMPVRPPPTGCHSSHAPLAAQRGGATTRTRAQPRHDQGAPGVTQARQSYKPLPLHILQTQSNDFCP
jgi:hypothetical protein